MMEDIETVAPLYIGDTPDPTMNPSEVKTFNPFLQSPTNFEEIQNEVIENEKPLLLDNDILTENEQSKSNNEIQVLEEKTDRKLFMKVYNNIVDSSIFVLNKVIIPFGEYILTNSTLWIILKSTLEVFLEMLLYIILAICYVFLKFISQIENKSKPKKNEEEPTNS